VTINYPKHHQNIVTALMGGEFITIDDSEKYSSIKNNELFYINFFKRSFGFDLKIEFEYCFLTSEKTDENTSRNIAVFFSLFCSGIDKQGGNFLEKLNSNSFTLSEIWCCLEDSSWGEVLEANSNLNSKDNVRKFMKKMEKRNIVKRNNSTYRFTKAYKFFINFIKKLN